MSGTRAAPRLLVTDAQRADLEVIAVSTSLSYRAVRQAGGLLDAAEGLANEEIGRRHGVSANTVRAWRATLAQRGVGGVGVVAQGRGRKPWLPEGTVAQVVAVTLTQAPRDGSTHWSTRSLAKRMGISHGSVARIWRDHELKPWKVDTFKISNESVVRGQARGRGRSVPGSSPAGGGVLVRREPNARRWTGLSPVCRWSVGGPRR